jgi:hypothetical protein
MGIKKLNNYVKTHCAQSICEVHLSELAGKRIAIDVSIYLYKYETDGCLIENMFNMISIMKYYKIEPIFVFDGKPPPEKKDILLERKTKRQMAQMEYNRLAQEKCPNANELDQLKKQCVFIDKTKVDKVKELIEACGAIYINAKGEADKLCAALVIRNEAWACMSEDMDLFVYGCKRVLRYFSLLKHNVIYYNTKSILLQLGITLKEFREICILSGTDYHGTDHLNATTLLLENCFEWHKLYVEANTEITFYEWLCKTEKIMEKDLQLLNGINRMFDLKNEEFEFLEVGNSMADKQKMRQILEEDNFVFL